MNKTKGKVICAKCGYTEEFEDNGSVDCMPDGFILPNGEWVCDDCGRELNIK